MTFAGKIVTQFFLMFEGIAHIVPVLASIHELVFKLLWVLGF